MNNFSAEPEFRSCDARGAKFSHMRGAAGICHFGERVPQHRAVFSV
jgi:hypothetical protein